MMKSGAEVAQLSPSANGWRLRHAGAVRDWANLTEAARALPARVPLHLALPCQTALLERLSLPAKDREEVAGMAQLQLEKTLPYPVEEVTSGLEIVAEEGEGSSVLSMAVHTPVLAEMCQPLRNAGHLPERITLFAQSVAAGGATADHELLVWPEQENLVLAVAEKGRLAWAQVIAGQGAEALEAELPAFLLGVEMNGVSSEFERVRLASECAGLAPILREAVGCPVEVFPVEQVTGEGEVNFLPAGWAAEAAHGVRVERLQQRLMLAAVLYLILVAVAFLYLAWTKRSVQNLDVQIAQLQPKIQTTRQRQERWETLAPAFDWHLFTIETLSLINQCSPNPDAKITLFSCQPGHFAVEGEAPSAELAIDFAERMRKEPGLSDYKIEAGLPQILPNGHAQFHINGTKP